MAQATVTVDGFKVTSTRPQSAQISIHIHHKSALEQLLGAMGSLKKFLSYPQARIHYGQLSLGVRASGHGLLRWHRGWGLSLWIGCKGSVLDPQRSAQAQGSSCIWGKDLEFFCAGIGMERHN